MSDDQSVRAFSALTPVIAGKELALRAHIESLHEDGRSPFACVAGTHFARLAMLPELPYNGPPQRPDSLKSQYLLFSAYHDGPSVAWVAGLAESLREKADAIWGNCIGYGGPRSLLHYLLYNRMAEPLLFFKAYDATTTDVRYSLDLRSTLIDFAAAHAEAAPATLAAAWRAQFGHNTQ